VRCHLARSDLNAFQNVVVIGTPMASSLTPTYATTASPCCDGWHSQDVLSVPIPLPTPVRNGSVHPKTSRQRSRIRGSGQSKARRKASRTDDANRMLALVLV
jgi:hypothetical protein